ncbi:hypothetical protein VCV18_007085 [Metarhizium anisopliae]
MAVFCGQVQGREEGVGWKVVDVKAVGIDACGDGACCTVDVGAVGKQETRNLWAVVVGGDGQGREAAGQRLVDLGALADQELRHVEAPIPDGIVQRRVPPGWLLRLKVGAEVD